jgi:chemotaxis response regulator CheB
VRIGVVTNVAAVAEVLRRVVGLKPEHHVIWVAASGAEAVARCSKETPDLVLIDLLLAGMDGVETTRRIMASTPCAILLVTPSVRVDAGRVFEAMGHGALDAIDTPVLAGGDLREVAAPLLTKIDTSARLIAGKQDAQSAVGHRDRASRCRHDRLIAIGASAGGPAVLATMLRHLPKDFPAAIVIVQHVDEQFASGMAEWLDQDSALFVRVAKEGDQPTVGHVLLASTGDHLTLKSADRLGYTAVPRDRVYRPSVDVFFQSVCRLWRGEAVGVLLTGMGRDGALGLRALRDQGHYTIAQDEATSAVYGMPKAAATLDAAVDILAAERIAPKLIEVMSKKLNPDDLAVRKGPAVSSSSSSVVGEPHRK